MNHAQFTALGRALRVVGEHGEQLTAEATDARLHEIRNDLRRALDLLEESVSQERPTTRCAEHPHGPVDKDAPDLCLLCETRRRAARRAQYTGGPRRAPAPAHEGPVPSRYGVRGDRPEPQQRWLPELWNGREWQLCGTPRHDRREAELYIAAQRRGPRAASAYRLVHEFTDYEVVRVWGTPVRTGIEPLGHL
ncbi:hypothetical protein [Streptomyces thermodiastaticus]|uniref:hypothetical protein n=1 Tax=Streptomyces thermodiastaticus TaxID=44061 RepID=UPI00167A6C1F|nr:hypothetical protein [Streptomyces thermodiastaticus]MCE7550703.1 hypothetical protein [Streptomyces thermodiastaticus]GHF71259.1 hypothetical protein GCM10018787_19700 [Streptomyces thermodiastaticus]